MIVWCSLIAYRIGLGLSCGYRFVIMLSMVQRIIPPAEMTLFSMANVMMRNAGLTLGPLLSSVALRYAQDKHMSTLREAAWVLMASMLTTTMLGAIVAATMPTHIAEM